MTYLELRGSGRPGLAHGVGAMHDEWIDEVLSEKTGVVSEATLRSRGRGTLYAEDRKGSARWECRKQGARQEVGRRMDIWEKSREEDGGQGTERMDGQKAGWRTRSKNK